MNKKIISTVFFISVGMLINYAYTEEAEEFDLGQVVVTSTKKKALVLDIPASVTIITAEDIEKSGYSSTAEIIGNLPSIIDQSQGDSYSFDFRGTKSSDSHGPHILIDGREVNLGIFGFNIIGSIPLEVIKSIEVIRTPGAYISGRDSSRGVINIVTKRGREGDKIFNSQLYSSYGSWDTYRESVSAWGNTKKTNYFLNATYKDSKGYRHTYPTYKTLLGNFNYEMTETLQMGLDLQYNNESRRYSQGLKEWQLDEGYRRSAEVPSSQSSSAYMKKQNTIENEVLGSTVSLDYSENYSRAGFVFNLSDYEDHYIYRAYDNSPTLKKYHYKKDRTQDIYSFKMFGGRNFDIGSVLKDSIEVGCDSSWQEGNQKTIYPYDDTASSKEAKGTIDYNERYNGIFLNNELNYQRFNLGSGLRYELTYYKMSSKEPKKVSNDFKKLAWDVAPSYEIFSEGNLYFNVNRSYFYPTAGYFYYAMDKDSPDNRAEDLRPEETTSYEIGFKHHFADWLSYSINFFYMDVSDRFLSFYDDSGDWKGWKNVGDSTNKGVEFEAEGELLTWLGYEFNFSYLNAKWDSGTLRLYEYGATPADDILKKMDISGKTVSDVPEFQYRVGINFIPPIAGLRFNMGLSYIGEKYIDAWNRYKNDDVYLVDGKIMYKVSDWSFYLSGENIFNVAYEKIYNSSSARNSNGSPNNTYYPKNGCYFEGGASYKF